MPILIMYDTNDLGVKNLLGNRRIRLIAHLLPNHELKALAVFHEASL
jgi:hypothetical protein